MTFHKFEKIFSVKKIILLAVSLIFMFWLPVWAEESDKTTNYCKDAASWQEWHDLLEKYPEDDVVCALYAMRRGLCSMVEGGSIPLAKAAAIFEKMKESVIAQRKEHNRAVEGKAKQGI